jgi:hypothetical protein
MAPLFYPSFQALRLADVIFEEIARRVPGYVGRLGAAWYWRLAGGTLVTFWLDYTVTEERWDVIRAQASNGRAGVFNRADFPFAAYGTLLTSPPYIHDLQGLAEWSNRLYFNMGHLIAEGRPMAADAPGVRHRAPGQPTGLFPHPEPAGAGNWSGTRWSTWTGGLTWSACGRRSGARSLWAACSGWPRSGSPWGCSRPAPGGSRMPCAH